MASIKTRTRADGGNSYQVRWVIGGGDATGDGSKSYGAETFTNQSLALDFKRRVEASSNLWPEGWVKGEGMTGMRWDDEIESWVPDATAAAKDGPTFADVAQGYFEQQERRIRRGKVKPMTLQRYRAMYRLHLEPTFGHMPFTEIRLANVEQWVDDEVDVGTKPKSIRNWHGLLFGMMSFGQQRLELRPDNPCAGTELPSVDKRALREEKHFGMREYVLLRAELNDQMRLLADTKLATACRYGEITAITVEDVDFRTDQHAVITINKAWSQRAKDDDRPIRDDLRENGAWRLDDPKQGSGRYVSITGALVQRLREHIAGKADNDYVFATMHGNPWRYPEFYSAHWHPARERAMAKGLKRRMTPHMLRHSAAVFALEEVGIHKVSDSLGHKSIEITWDVYGGLVNKHDTSMADALSKAMEELDRFTITESPEPDDQAA